MVGRFKKAADAKVTEERIRRLRTQLESQSRDTRENEWDLPAERLSDDLVRLLKELNLFHLGPADVEGFHYDYTVELDGSTITIKTDEIEVLGLLKLLIDGDARVEVY